MDKKKASLISSSEPFAKRRAIFLSVRKTVNIQGYSKLREPIKTRENCYPLIWQILKLVIFVTWDLEARIEEKLRRHNGLDLVINRRIYLLSISLFSKLNCIQTIRVKALDFSVFQLKFLTARGSWRGTFYLQSVCLNVAFSISSCKLWSVHFGYQIFMLVRLPVPDTFRKRPF